MLLDRRAQAGVIVDLLFVAFNRLEFTEPSLGALVANTDWDLVRTLHIHDDGSTDGTAQYLADAAEALDDRVDVHFETRRLGGPVAATNRHLDLFAEPAEADDVSAFVKLDNDVIVSPGWLDELTRVASANPGVDYLGVQPRFGPPVPGLCEERRVEEARHIGGVGLMRYRAFEVCRPVANGRYGGTEFQCRHPETRKGWLTPDLPCFCLDLVDLEPYATFAAEHIANGWARPWPKYVDGGRSYYDWWAT